MVPSYLLSRSFLHRHALQHWQSLSYRYLPLSVAICRYLSPSVCSPRLSIACCWLHWLSILMRSCYHPSLLPPLLPSSRPALSILHRIITIYCHLSPSVCSPWLSVACCWLHWPFILTITHRFCLLYCCPVDLLLPSCMVSSPSTAIYRHLFALPGSPSLVVGYPS